MFHLTKKVKGNEKKPYQDNWAQSTFTFLIIITTHTDHFIVKYGSPRADGAKRRARLLIPPGYLHPGKRKH
jgi:hypothetical protein